VPEIQNWKISQITSAQPEMQLTCVARMHSTRIMAERYRISSDITVQDTQRTEMVSCTIPASDNLNGTADFNVNEM
jgi:hypothetical protein